MPSKDYLMLTSAQRACPRLELGARLEARTASLHQSTFWASLDSPLSWVLGNPSDRPIPRPRGYKNESARFRNWITPRFRGGDGMGGAPLGSSEKKSGSGGGNPEPLTIGRIARPITRFGGQTCKAEPYPHNMGSKLRHTFDKSVTF